jgi:sulfoxide reductase heme-binding subunit YedZ
MVIMLWQVIQIEGFNGNYDSLLVSSGKWALRFLLLSLLMTPLNALFGWRNAVKLRKPAGLWAFEFGAIHFLANLATLQEEWLKYPRSVLPLPG